jgi:glycosyltransferase involved in cell wall biosynthesis
MVKLSVIVCTYNPNAHILNKVLLALQQQTLNRQYWELIIVNNNSSIDIPAIKNIAWHNNYRVIFEANPGLAHARLSGFKQCTPKSLIVFVDDDNVLNNNYLENCLAFSLNHPQVGCFGGKSIPVYETTPPTWFNLIGINLGCQNFGDDLYISQYKNVNYTIIEYPGKAPIGTGMAITYNAFSAHLNAINGEKLKFGRKGTDLTSGEDNDIILTVIKHGFEIAYVPQLELQHIIPQYRYSIPYLKKMAYKSNISWMKVLAMHQINPYHKISKWTIIPRQLKAWFKLAAWKNEVNNIKWRGACGVFKGLSEI